MHDILGTYMRTLWSVAFQNEVAVWVKNRRNIVLEICWQCLAYYGVSTHCSHNYFDITTPYSIL